ncbi:MAG: F0F1 ATP synthase subunit gamma [Lentisphaerae bacterium]|nr:F0F1 ATP synthase subunit gamma [Lentisphaerota bacterium]
MQLNELRKELRFNGELVKLIETLKNIAAAQYHTMEKAKQRFEEFMQSFAGFFRVVNLVDVADPLVRVSSDVLGIIMVTSDSGFMGGLNQGVIRAAMDAQGAHSNELTELVVIGEKGASALQDQGRTFRFFPGVAQDTRYEQAQEVRDFIVEEVLNRRMGRVLVSYPRPVSFTAQTIDVVSLLPCAALFDKEAESDVARRVGAAKLIAEARQVIVESRFPDLVEYLAATWVASKLYEIFEDAKLAEFSARAMHLEGSFQSLQREQKKLRHRTFKAVHEKIDRGMRESFAARSKNKRAAVAPEQAAAPIPVVPELDELADEEGDEHG